MAYDGKLLARARGELEKIKAENSAEQQRRREKLYEEIPSLERIETSMRLQMVELAKLVISGKPDAADRIAELRQENTDLREQRKALITGRGYPENYLDKICSCPLCEDTGMLKNKVCSCLDKLYKAEITKELAPLLRSSDARFEAFNINYYDADYRRLMKTVFDACRDYAENFAKNGENILMQGPTGVGKTFLSACIARVVAEKGFSVCYEPIVSALEAFELQRFARDAEAADDAAKKVRRMLDCDLLILDDLGTEIITGVTVSALYTLIDTRLNSGLPMIISTNCSDEDLTKRYTPQICSRLSGSFKNMPFAGNDIRKIKKEG